MTRLRTGVGVRKDYRKIAGVKSRRSKVAKTLAPRARKAVATIAKRVFARSTETKYLSEDIVPLGEDALAAQQIYGATDPGVAQVWPVMPQVPQGTTTANEYTREGVKIQPTRLEVDVELFFNNLRKSIDGTGNLDDCSWDLTVHMWYGYVRKYKQNQDIIANATLICQNLLDNGDGTTSAWSGNPLDHHKKINREYFVGLKHRAIRMSRPLGVQNTATLSGGVTTYFPQKINKMVRLSYKLPKTLLFNETNVDPENYAPILMIGYQHNDNTLASNTYIAPGVQPADISRAAALLCAIKSHLWFKDA